MVIARTSGAIMQLDKDQLEDRIIKLHTRAKRLKDGSKRIKARDEIDRLLEEHHERWPKVPAKRA